MNEEKVYTLDTQQAYDFCKQHVEDVTGEDFPSIHYFKGLLRNDGIPARRTGSTPKGFRYKFSQAELRKWLNEIYIPVFVGVHIGPDV